jgi:hypothetical protein
VLVSDPADLAKVNRNALARFPDIRVLTPAMHAPDEDAAPMDPGEAASTLSGLHAKLYVLDQGKQAHVWTGSANATRAAFGRNVELLVELVGPKGRLGVDALLAKGKGGEPSFSSLLERYDPLPDAECDEVGESLMRLVESARKVLGATAIDLHVQPSTEPDTFDMTLTGPSVHIEAGAAELSITCRPITLGDGHTVAIDWTKRITANFPKVSFEAITSFVAFGVSAKKDRRVVEERFVLNLRLIGAPAERRQRIIQGLLRDERAVIRFILMLLADDVDLSAARFEQMSGGTGVFALGFEGTVLESLLRAFVRDPQRLDRVAQLLADLKAGGEALTLSKEFEEVWSAVWAAHRERSPS